jgi:flagellar assembly factor FliW
MHIQSTRFGEIEVGDESLLTFPEGLIGLPGTRYALVAITDETPFMWLHSVDHPDVALPVTTPWLFFSGYEVRVPEEDARLLELASPADADIFCVVRAAEKLEGFTINLAGPLIVHKTKRLGRQIINDTGGYPVRQPLFAEVELNEVQAVASVPAAATAV